MTPLFESPLALAAGVLTVASPCVLPMLPLLLGSGAADGSRSRSLSVVAGFVLTFAAVGLLLASVAREATALHEAIRLTALVLLGVSGLLRLWPATYDRLVAAVTARLPAGGSAPRGPLSGFVLGMSLGAVWTPCAGPVLASILALVAQAQDLNRAALLLTLYALGAAVPMGLIAWGGRAVAARLRWLTAPAVQQAFGLLVVLTALAMLFHYDVLIAASLSALFI